MKRYYYILTTPVEITNYESKDVALKCYEIECSRCENVRLERADSKYGTAKVIKAKNNIWN